MDIETILQDKTRKPKEKTEALSLALADKTLSPKELIEFASEAKDPLKATCIEALEFATQKDPNIIDEAGFRFVTDNLSSKAPRVKWESAKVIGNTARLFEKHLDGAIEKLLINTEDDGTVVRWSAAFAIAEIIKLQTPRNKELIPAVEAIMEREEKNSIKKIYLAALKKLVPKEKKGK